MKRKSKVDNLFKQLKLAYKTHNNEKVISLTKEILDLDNISDDIIKEIKKNLSQNKDLVHIKKEIMESN
ncbi:MAG: hypothetical protein KGD57_05100 [Candidatus Lokiarchaeota archaeon]|nr:hypothetical protein [Candidatus Lokiarchaeota archaeon]